jgi:maltose 6'-phosphate phosphatase
MRAYFKRPTSLFFFTIVLCLPHLSRAASNERDVQCLDVVNRGMLNVLTINILFSEIENRNTRLDRIAQFVKSQFEAANPVDVILFKRRPAVSWSKQRTVLKISRTFSTLNMA